MSHGPEHQIEHAEHAAHAAHDEFNKNVTMSIAIIAALLACVAMFGHRSHNDTLRLQGEALTLQTKASIKSTETANAWAYYQTKNLVNLESEIAVDVLSVVVIQDGKHKEYNDIVNGYKSNIKKYSGDDTVRSHSKAKQKSGGGTDDGQEEKGKGRLAELQTGAEKLKKETEEILKEADDKIAESHKEHMKAARLDYSELGLQFAVVLCSLAILMKNRVFWFGGIVSGVVGTLIAVTGLCGMFMGEHH
jgi:Domain of unknown function (DUF4337)